jgi:cyclic pyranopterin phosphate synthase
MFDAFQRRINYLRISVTDRCNLRCSYCMPAEGIQLIPREDVLTFDEIVSFAQTAVAHGIEKIRLTGGEPLVRRGIVELVGRIARLEGLKDFGMTTNGLRLVELAQPLKEAGLHRLNISLDSIDPNRYREITRCGNLADVIAGIDAAVRAGFDPIKLNCVVKESSDEADAHGVAAFGKERGMQVRFIRMMNLENGEFWPVEGGEGGKCATCSRLRLSSAGRLYPCLFSDRSYDVREVGAEEAIRRAIGNKPAAGHKASHEFTMMGG